LSNYGCFIHKVTVICYN